MEEQHNDQDHLFKAKHTMNEGPPDKVKMKGIMMDAGATSHIVNDIGKFESFDDSSSLRPIQWSWPTGPSAMELHNEEEQRWCVCWTTPDDSTEHSCGMHCTCLLTHMTSFRWQEQPTEE
ncbi:hypothetical protein AAFF_G00218450 [Aldrovandia affinis]|uniref:Uncharacterized protein n=1 Tax=Aldrovandia affinis TaxID=143900 RepID=A0AAD7SW05_9TELE|nr:hypothetical protein AAFF_G00218450 [Aldrovandia affinis]